MDSRQIRQAAQEAFMESMERLRQTLDEGAEANPPSAQKRSPRSRYPAIPEAKDLPPSADALFEQAIADIDRAMGLNADQDSDAQS